MSQESEAPQQDFDAGDRAPRTLPERVREVLGSDSTPFHGRNAESWCDWCGAVWMKPLWSLDPQPPYFGHPRNGCLIWQAEPAVSVSALRALVEKMARVSPWCANELAFICDAAEQTS
jgi:hypothetical protein